MATYTSTIQLQNGTETDFATFHAVLEAQAKMSKQHVELAEPQLLQEERKYFWDGNVTLQKIAQTILKAAPVVGKRYSFSIMRNKYSSGHLA